MSNGILVFVEHRDGAINKTSFEAIAAAQSLGAELQQPVTAVLPGSDIGALAQQMANADDEPPDAGGEQGLDQEGKIRGGRHDGQEMGGASRRRQEGLSRNALSRPSGLS